MNIQYFGCLHKSSKLSKTVKDSITFVKIIMSPLLKTFDFSGILFSIAIFI